MKKAMDYDYWITDPEYVTEDEVSIDFENTKIEIKHPMLDVVLYSYVKLLWIKQDKLMFQFPFQVEMTDTGACDLIINKPWGVMGTHLLIETQLQGHTEKSK
jgi:hypothetical protein